MTTLKKFVVISFITTYLGTLSWGVAAHALRVGICGNTMSYFVVWDMFCGWTAWDQRTHVIAEGNSGQFYEVKEPWGAFKPFGNVARIHYDNTNLLLTKHIQNVLTHTSHEQIDRVYVVQEVWPKQYNLPADLYSQYFDRPKDKVSYFHLRAVTSNQGYAVQTFPGWFAQQELNSLYDNPRLQKQASNANSVYNTLYVPRNGQMGGTSFTTN